MQQQTNINDLAVQSFAHSVEDLIKERKDWEQNAFKSANDSLYDLLTQIYKMYDETCTCDEIGKARREWLKQQIEVKDIKCKRKASFMHLLTKLVFSESGINSRRVNTYARVLNIAASTKSVQHYNDLKDFIVQHGGIEEIRTSISKSGRNKAIREEKAREMALSSESIFQIGLTKDYGNEDGEIVTLLGVLNKDGTCEIKHVCKQEKSNKKSGGTAIKSVLANFYASKLTATKQ